MCGEQHYVSALAGLWTDAVIWGCVYVLAQRRDGPRFFLPISIVMFLICSTTVIEDFALVLLTPDMVTNQICKGWACVSCTTETTSHLSQSVFNDLIAAVQDPLFLTNLLLGDGLLIYRCFVLWKGTRWERWVVVLPILLLLASSATACAEFYYDLELWRIRRDSPLSEAIPPPNWLAINELSFKFRIAAYILPLATTVLTTVLIASRIWWCTHEFEKELGRRVGSKYRRAIALVIESGAIYSASLIIEVTVLYTSPMYSGISGVEQIMGIAPTLIIVRLGLGQGIESTFRQPTANHASQVLSPTPRGIEFAQDSGDIESQHEPCLIREKPSSNEMTCPGPSIEEVDISDRMPGSPPVENTELDGFDAHKSSRSGST